MADDTAELLSVQPPYMLNVDSITNTGSNKYSVKISWKGAADPNIWFKVRYLSMDSTNLDDYVESEWIDSSSRYEHTFTNLQYINSDTLIETQYCFQVKAYMTICENTEESTVDERPRISVYPSEVRMDENGGTETIRVYTNSGNAISSSISQSETWLTVDKNNTTLTATENTGSLTRFARVRFSTNYTDDTTGDTVTISADCIVRQLHGGV